ncbi:hypothetical protein AMJ51_01570 [Microgenomates bacterium DG_75]|nr:MAG: hypothetical protein AMJ51_01570 [Microgenomates bacterium DG_75]
MGQGFPAKIWREAKEEYQELRQEGRLLYWTTIKIPGEGYEAMVPYVVALIRLSKDKVIGGQLVSWQGKQLKKGMKVVSVPRRMRANGEEGPIRYGIKWKVR